MSVFSPTALFHLYYPSVRVNASCAPTFLFLALGFASFHSVFFLSNLISRIIRNRPTPVLHALTLPSSLRSPCLGTELPSPPFRYTFHPLHLLISLFLSLSLSRRSLPYGPYVETSYNLRNDAGLPSRQGNLLQHNEVILSLSCSSILFRTNTGQVERLVRLKPVIILSNKCADTKARTFS